MTRLAALAGIVLVLAGCNGTNEPGTPVVAVVVDDSLGSLEGGPVPSPDGTRLAFARTVAGKSAIWIASADGSNQVRLTHGVWDVEPFWSPDGRSIAYHAESPDFDVFVVSVDGGEPRAVTSGPAFDRPRGWLPDGSAVIIFRTGPGDEATMVAPLDGSPPRRLGPLLAGDVHASFSPNGSRLGFDVHQGGGDATIWVLDSTAGTPRQLTTENLENAQPHNMWSPDGRFIAYTSARTGTRDIWIADVTTGELRQLTSDVRDDNNPRWSPDGRWIAFLSDRGGQTDLWVVPSAGGTAVRVTNDPATEQFPRWSHDGGSLLYARRQSEVVLSLLPRDGGAGQSLLSWSGYAIGWAVLSPDGSTVLFASDRSGNSDIWSLAVTGGEPAPFITSPLEDFAPLYSRDGSQVLFRSNRAGSMDLWVVPAAGGEPRRLTEGPGNVTEAAWAPDGASIAFVSDRGGPGGDVWRVAASGGEPVRLTSGNLRPNSVDWSPDGQFLFFGGARPDGNRELYRMPAAGGRPRPLGANPGIGNSMLSPDGSQLSYSSFEGGWAFVDLIPSSGGTPQRLTQETEGVYHPRANWSSDGSYLLVHHLDLAGNRDAFDLYTFTLGDRSWKRLTSTPKANEQQFNFTQDGRQMLVVTTTTAIQIMTVPVADLLAGAK